MEFALLSKVEYGSDSCCSSYLNLVCVYYLSVYVCQWLVWFCIFLFSLSVSRNTFSLSLILTLSHTTCCAEASCVERCALLKLKYSFLDSANADFFSLKIMHSIGWETLYGQFHLNYLGSLSAWYYGLSLSLSFCLHQPAYRDQIGGLLSLLLLFIETPALCSFPFYSLS